MTGAGDYEPERTRNRIDEQLRGAIASDVRHRPERARVELEQSGYRLAGALGELIEDRRRDFNRHLEDAVGAGLDQRSCPGIRRGARAAVD